MKKTKVLVMLILTICLSFCVMTACSGTDDKDGADGIELPQPKPVENLRYQKIAGKEEYLVMGM